MHGKIPKTSTGNTCPSSPEKRPPRPNAFGKCYNLTFLVPHSEKPCNKETSLILIDLAVPRLSATLWEGLVWAGPTHSALSPLSVLVLYWSTAQNLAFLEFVSPSVPFL